MKKIVSLFTVLCCLLFSATVFANEPDVVNVSNARELVQAIKPDTVINLAPGTYNLTDASDITSQYVSWEDTFDGPQLNITDVNNLSIVGTANASDCHLVVTPSYADVMQFYNCNKIKFSGVKMGHLKTGGCVGSVLHFAYSKSISLTNCDIYGCGVIGLECNDCNSVNVNRSVIHDCSSNLVYLENTAYAVFNQVTFQTSRSTWGPAIAMTGPLANNIYNECAFRGFIQQRLFSAYNSRLYGLSIKNCTTTLFHKYVDEPDAIKKDFNYTAPSSGSPADIDGLGFSQYLMGEH